MSPSKSDLRKTLRDGRQAFVKYNKNAQLAFDSRIDILAPLIDLCSTVAAYDSFGAEVSVARAMAFANAKGKVVALPHIATSEVIMRFKRWTPGAALCARPFGFRQPADDAADAHPDLILVPLVGFDRQLQRLGQGGGYYDRYLSNNNNALKVGIAWSCQEVDAIPVDGWDVRLDAILTEKDWIVGAKSVIAR